MITVNIDKCGISVRKENGTLVCYSHANWSTFGVEPMERIKYLNEKWARFLRLIIFISPKIAVIRNETLILTKGPQNVYSMQCCFHR